MTMLLVIRKLRNEIAPVTLANANKRRRYSSCTIALAISMYSGIATTHSHISCVCLENENQRSSRPHLRPFAPFSIVRKLLFRHAKFFKH